MDIRKLLFCIVIPAATSFLTGAWFTLHGVTNWGITILLVVVALCAAWGHHVGGSKVSYEVVWWLLEVFTGFLYIKVLAGLLGEFGALMYVLVLLLFVLMVIFTVKHVKKVESVAEIKRPRRKEPEEQETTQQTLQQVPQQTPQQTPQQVPQQTSPQAPQQKK